jgi:hypothetical protein
MDKLGCYAMPLPVCFFQKFETGSIGKLEASGFDGLTSSGQTETVIKKNSQVQTQG